MQSISEAADYTLRFINQTQRSVFLTGKAGTGKTTLLREIIQTTHKNTVVVAPTGIAALNAGGVTIHSMFQLPFGGFIPDNNATNFADNIKFETPNTLRRVFRMSGQKKLVIQNMELLIIDEVSMLRADLLDAIDCVMQSIRKNRLPFGGVQVLFIGDLLQLPPVVRDDEWRTLKNYYKGKFFFHSHVVQQNPPLYIELSKIFRQTDDRFISVLNNLRNNHITANDIEVLNQYVQPNFDLKGNPGYITLTTHNAKADSINAKALQDLNGKLVQYYAEIVDDFPEKIFPLEATLQLKIGAQVMFVKNDLSIEKRYFNGKMGAITSLSDQEIVVYFQEENKSIIVEKQEWQNIKYAVNPNSKEIEETVLGTFVHYPIKLAWAITVHKSQGLTFDKAALDVSQVFMPGQAYVALSRLRSLNGLVLLSPLQMNGISNDQDVMDYALNKADDVILKSTLASETKRFIHIYLKNSFDWNDLAQEWRNHQFDFQEHTEKSSHGIWAKEQSGVIWNLLLPSTKFMSQLDQLFHQDDFDINRVSERMNAAYNYFIVPMDKMVDAVLWKLEEVQRIKKAKGLYEALLVLEELQIRAVHRLMRAKLLIETVVSGSEISKATLHSDSIRNYKSIKVDFIREEFKNKNSALIEEDYDVQRYTSKKKTKATKKSTVEETYDLWQQKNSIKAISVIRKLTPQTINSHIAKLIESKAISISEVLSEDKIIALAIAFIGYKEESLAPLKEKTGDQFTWDELRMFKASIGK
jgi:hypothetical protein